MLWDLRETGSHQGYDRSRGEAVDGGEDDDGGVAGRSLPAHSEDSRADSHEKQHVETANLIGRNTGDDPPKEGSGIEYGGKIKGKLSAHTLRHSVGRDVEYRYEDAEDTQPDGEDESNILRLLEGA